jgi:uncharacterized protein
MNKFEKLKRIIKDMGSVLVAYSGGADSTFLLKVCADVLADKVLAVTAISPTYQKSELRFSKSMAGKLGVAHKILKTFELNNKRFAANPVDRCYYCKKELFSTLKDIAGKNNFNFVADASNKTDTLDYRPGVKAKKELNVRSPLQEAGLTKEEIRALSKKLGLPTWDKPSLACLASRIPYGKAISGTILERVYNAETVLNEMGFLQARVRHYDTLCRIEVPENEIAKLVARRAQVVDRLKKMGYNYITVDLEGYRTGSMNEVITL